VKVLSRPSSPAFSLGIHQQQQQQQHQQHQQHHHHHHHHHHSSSNALANFDATANSFNANGANATMPGPLSLAMTAPSRSLATLHFSEGWVEPMSPTNVQRMVATAAAATGKKVILSSMKSSTNLALPVSLGARPFPTLHEGRLPHKLQAVLQQTPWPDLTQMKNMSTLSIKRAGFGLREVQYLPAVLELTPNIRNLDLSVNNLGSDWCSVLKAGLVHCSDVTTLELCSCNIQDLQGLSCALEETNTATTQGVRRLNLSSNSLMPQSFKALPPALKETPKLISLDLSRNVLGEMGAHFLGRALRHTHALQSLFLGECKIGAGGAKYLSEGLSHITDIRELSLPCNDLGQEGAEELVEGLLQTTMLSALDLTWNSIGQEGIRALALGLQQCRRLKKVSLGGNGLGPSAERELSQGLGQVARGLLLPPIPLVA